MHFTLSLPVTLLRVLGSLKLQFKQHSDLFWPTHPPSNSNIHYATHDTRLKHSHRKLRLAEDFEMLRLTPDFETLRLTCDAWRKILKFCAWRLILKHCAWCVISKHCARCPSDARQTQLFKTLRLTPARRQPDVTFWNQVSGARFQNQAPDVIFCDHASDVQYESGYVEDK